MSARTLEAWRDALAGLDLPTPVVFGATSGATSGDGARRERNEVWLAPEVLTALAHATRVHDLPIDLCVAGAWALALTWATRQDEHVFGLLDDSGARPLRVRLDQDTCATDWLRALHARERERQAWPQQPTWDALATACGLPPGRPLVASVVRVGARAAHAALPVSPAALLDFDPSDGRLRLESVGTCLDASVAQRLLSATAAALAHWTRAPAAPWSAYDLLSPDDRERLDAWNHTAVDFARDATLPELFARQVAAQPDAPALRTDDLRLTYAQLERRANQLAWRLRALGAGPDVPVALLLERSAETVVAVLAIAKAGSAYLALEPAYPDERLAFMLDDAQARLVLTQASLRHALHAALARRPAEGAPITLLALDDLDERTRLRGLPEEAPRVPGLTSAHLAYLAYTSGSTGTPKGAAIPQRAVSRLVCAVDYLRLGPGEVLLHAAPLAFDASTLEIWGALLTGGCVAVHPERVPTPGGLRDSLVRHGVTTAWLTAALFNAVVDDQPEALRGLRQLLTGGEALSVSHVRRAQRALPGTQLFNGYGPTECTTFTNVHAISADLPDDAPSVPIGRPIRDTRLYVLDARRRRVPPGFTGELYVGGAGLARGYLARPALTAERFVPDPYGPPGERLYRTGDLVRFLADGALDYQGRADTQVKVRGFRIEPAEIEATLLRHAGLARAAVLARPAPGGDTRLVAYVVPSATSEAPSAAILRAHLARTLPEYMLPAAFVTLERLPVTLNGKLDTRALPEPTRARPEELREPYAAPRGTTQTRLCAAFADTLDVHPVGVHDNFFELGGTSLLGLRLLGRLRAEGWDIPAVRLFQYPTVAALERWLEGRAASGRPAARDTTRVPSREPVAIVGLAGRFPGADDVERFWDNLCAGVESVRYFERHELDPSLDPARVAAPDYVAARGVLSDVAGFDAAFFGIPPREAEVMDPQQRLFLEVAWEALESAGYVPETTPGPIGVFGGMYNATYYQRHVSSRPDLIERVGEFQVMVANEKDYVATRTAHRLNLTGPAVSVHTACSTSLVAVCQAMQALHEGACDLALAGGVAVTCPPRSGYVYQEGAMLARDGHTRPFDAQATGTVFSDGVALVALRRLSDARRDGDTIHAIILGGAINNDGAHKASFTAPSVEGQAAVVAAAHAAAGVEAASIGYVEAHGTATPLGDPIEVEALTQAFGLGPVLRGTCGLGSLKSNVGHLVIAAGVAGLIKTALALRHARLPPTLHFRSPNPKIDFAASPFYVVDRLLDWPAGPQPRRAGVSSFGVGGTNAHVVLEEAPASAPRAPVPGPHLLLLSARSPEALRAARARLHAHATRHRELALADVAFTLHAGRKGFPERCALVADTWDEALLALADESGPRRLERRATASAPPVAFLFPGQGSQYAGMGRALYAREPAFRAAFDACCAPIDAQLGDDLRALLFDDADDAQAAERLRATAVTQPALFALEYALASLWRERGLMPTLLLGHSVGEFVCAVLAGVMDLADAARLVALRGQLMQQQAPGAMLSVRLSADALATRLPDDLALAADNGPAACVVAGPEQALAVFEARLLDEGVATRRLQTSHAFHSPMMEPAVAPFERELRALALRAPRVPIVSTATGTWLTDAQATDPGYWSRHLRVPVRFGPAARTLLADPDVLLLEVGPRATLITLARQQPGSRGRLAVASLGEQAETEPRALALACGQLWTAGVTLDAHGLHGSTRRVPLPTYPFEHQRYWIDAPAASAPAAAAAASTPRAEPASSPPAPAPPAALGPWDALALETLAAWAWWPAPMPPLSIAPETPYAPQAVPHEDPDPMEAMQETPSMPRNARLVSVLASLFEEVSGIEIAATDQAVTFMELGLDSLALTQVAQQLQKSFGVKVTFRQLMEDFASLERLAQHMDRHLPPDALPSPTPTTPAATPAVAPAAVAPGSPWPAPSAPPASGYAWPQPSAAGWPAAPAPPFPFPSPFAPTPYAAAYAWNPQALLMASVQAAVEQQIAPLRAALAQLTGQALPPAAAVSAAAPPAAATPAPAQPAAAPAVAAAAPAAEAPAGEEPVGRVSYDAKKAFGAIARIHLTRDELSPRQRARLEAFIARYTARTAASKRFTQEHRAQLADPRVVTGFRPTLKELVYPVVVARSQGARVWDLDGHEYIDVLNGFGCNYFGWQPEFVDTAVRRQLDLGHEIGPQTPLAGEVARLMCQFTGFDRAAFCNTGSEAVMGCLRIARTVTGRDTVALFSGSYHGIFDEVIVRGTRKLRAVPAAPGILPNTSQNVLVLDYGTPESLEILKARAGELAAIMVEPVQSRRPDFQPREFLVALRELSERAGCVYIFDEVITGFRTHPGGAQAHFGVRADLASYGKVVGGGYPIGVIAGKQRFMDALDGGHWQFGDDSTPTVGVTYFAGTFVRHPLALAAAKAVLEHLQEQGPELQERLNRRTAAFAEELNAFFEQAGVPLKIKHFSSLWKLFFLEEQPWGDLLFPMLRDRGVHVLEGFPCFFTTAHGDAELAFVAAQFKAAVAEMQESGFLPEPKGRATQGLDAQRPPVPGARLGRDANGDPAWFVPHPEQPGKYMQVGG